MSFLSLSDYGVVGSGETCAVISRLGSVDWCCFPYIDSPSHFTALRDQARGGKFQIAPEGDFRSEQVYATSSLVLETRFETPHGNGVITDWMSTDGPILYRQVQTLNGAISWNLHCVPRFTNGTHRAQAEAFRGGILFRGPLPEHLGFLRGSRAVEIDGSGLEAIGRFTLEAGQSAVFSWGWGRPALGKLPATITPPNSLEATIDHWRRSAHTCRSPGCPFAGPWHDLMVRSGLLLRALIAPYSGSVAETVVPLRPSTHRFTWIRDVAPAMAALANLGNAESAGSLFRWVSDLLVRDEAEGIQPAYSLDGGRYFVEPSELPASQTGLRTLHEFHLDTYGQAFLASVEYFRLFGKLPDGLWPVLSEIADYVAQAWRRPDYGAWQTLESAEQQFSRPEHFVSSKLFCWAALDRACWLAQSQGVRLGPRWVEERKILHRTICEQGYDPSQQSFVRTFSDRDLDPSCLLVPLLGFLPPDDLRVRGTLDALQSNLSEGIFIHAHKHVSVLSEKARAPSLFFSFLYVAALASCGRAEEASDRLAELCTYATPLGFFGDYVEVSSGQNLGSFPSAQVHLAMIQATLAVVAARGRQIPYPPLAAPAGAPISAQSA